MAGRIRWNRGSTESTLAAARKLATGHQAPRFVFATYNGLAIEATPPAFGQRHYRVDADGTVALVERQG
jgi:hypothetical protein